MKLLSPFATSCSRPNGRFEELRRAVLNGVAAENSRRNYGLALDELSAFCGRRKEPISRMLLLEFRSALLERNLSPSTINVKLSAIWSLIGEARRAGVLGAQEASQMTTFPMSARRELVSETG